ncbi:MAG TPA: hypothetical protein VF260_09065, partial [Bacilli bacterium]
VRLAGAVQLEPKWLTENGKAQVKSFVRRYIRSLGDALEVQKSEVIITCSEFSDIIETGSDDADDGSETFVIDMEFAEFEDFSVVLVRDDGDALTYDIYRQSRGGLPVGTAMVDINSREMTGYIDFYERSCAEERETIASLLMRELEKEREFKSLHLTMIYQNEPFAELQFAT